MTAFGPLSALFAVALLPFALVCCTKAPPPPAPTETHDPGTRLLPNPEASPEPFLGIDASTATTTVDASIASVSPPVDESPAIFCAAAMRDFSNAVAQSRACKTDDDCAIFQSGCGLEAVCGESVAKKAKPKLAGIVVRYEKQNCSAVVHAPCPTCAAPKPPTCVAGKCQ